MGEESLITITKLISQHQPVVTVLHRFNTSIMGPKCQRYKKLASASLSCADTDSATLQHSARGLRLVNTPPSQALLKLMTAHHSVSMRSLNCSTTQERLNELAIACEENFRTVGRSSYFCTLLWFFLMKKNRLLQLSIFEKSKKSLLRRSAPRYLSNDVACYESFETWDSIFLEMGKSHF